VCHLQSAVLGAAAHAVPFEAWRFVVLANVSIDEVIDEETNGIQCGYFPIVVEIRIRDLFG
jgi:hypothetical protein